MSSEATSALSLEALYRQVGPFALSKTTYLVGRPDVAEEIVQDVFLKLWQSRVPFETPKQAYAWIYRSCHNAGIDHLRSRRRATSAKGDLGRLVQNPETPDARLENRQILENVWSTLSERDARIVAYRFIDGMPVQAIAALLEVSEKTVQRAVSALTERRGHFYLVPRSTP